MRSTRVDVCVHERVSACDWGCSAINVHAWLRARVRGCMRLRLYEMNAHVCLRARTACAGALRLCERVNVRVCVVCGAHVWLRVRAFVRRRERACVMLVTCLVCTYKSYRGIDALFCSAKQKNTDLCSSTALPMTATSAASAASVPVTSCPPPPLDYHYLTPTTTTFCRASTKEDMPLKRKASKSVMWGESL